MNKEQFLLALYDALRGLPIEDVERSIAYYREMIDERVEDGMSEEEAVAALGSVEDIAAQILTDMPLRTLVHEKVTGGRKPPVWEIVLLILGAPLWFSLAVTALSLLFAFYIVLWAFALVPFAVTLSLAAAGVFGVSACVPMLVRAGFPQMLFSLGTGLVCIGLAVLMLYASIAAVRGMAKLSGQIWLWVKSLFVRKEAAR